MADTNRELTEEDLVYFQEFGHEMDAILDKYKVVFEYVATLEGLTVAVSIPTKDGLSCGSTALCSPLDISDLKDLVSKIVFSQAFDDMPD